MTKKEMKEKFFYDHKIFYDDIRKVYKNKFRYKKKKYTIVGEYTNPFIYVAYTYEEYGYVSCRKIIIEDEQVGTCPTIIPAICKEIIATKKLLGQHILKEVKYYLKYV